MSASGITIRPMGVGQILDTGITLVRSNFWLLASIAAWGIVPPAVLTTVLNGLVLATGSSVAATVMAGVVGGVASAIGLGLAYVALSLACARLIEGQAEIDAASLYRSSPGPFGRGILLGIIVVLLAIPLVILFPLGIYLYVRWFVSWVALVVEGLGPIACLSRSWNLTRGVWGHTFVVALAEVVISFVLSLVLGALLGLPAGILTFLLGENLLTIALSSAAGAVTNIVLAPFAVAFSVVLYYELRARTEGFDLAQRGLGLAGPGAPTTLAE